MNTVLYYREATFTQERNKTRRAGNNNSSSSKVVPGARHNSFSVWLDCFGGMHAVYEIQKNATFTFQNVATTTYEVFTAYLLNAEMYLA